MDILCVKIGENEPDSYQNFYQLSKHLDIVDLIRGKSSPGTMAEKEFLCFNVDLSVLSDEEFRRVKMLLKEPQTELLGYVLDKELGEQIPLNHVTAKRKRRLDLPSIDWLSTPTKGAIDLQASNRRSIKTSLYAYQSANGLSTLRRDKTLDGDVLSGELLTVPDASLDAEFSRRVAITGLGDLSVDASAYTKLSPEGKRIILDRITRQYLSVKQTEFAVPFDMRTINKLHIPVSYGQIADFVVDKMTGRTLRQDF